MMLALSMATTTIFTCCEEEDDYIAQKLREGDWQGYIDTYYQSRWNLQGNTFETVMRFESKGEYYTSGRGYEVDYDVRSPFNDYAYCTFKWFIVDGEITFIYDDSRWNPIYISNYSLTSSNFRGYLNDGSGRRIKFDLQNTNSYDGWNRYDRTGSYGDFWDQQYFHSRTRSADDTLDAISFIDRTEQARQESGNPEARSYASGVFAKAMSEE